MTATADVEIERLAAGGEGVARHESMVVFVPRTAPGDRARVRLDVRKRFARGVVDELLVPSPLRVTPPCPHYVDDRCGGCQIQHIAYAAQLDAKSGIVRDALVRIGKREVTAPTVVASEQQWRYRRKLTLAMRRRSDDWVIGLHPYDDPSAVFQLADCLITDEHVMAVWREIMAARAFFPAADELRASVQLGDAGAAVVLEGAETWPDGLAFFDAVPSATALWWKPEHRARTLVAERFGSDPSDPFIQGSDGSDPVAPSFIQVNRGVGAALHAYVLERTRAHAPGLVVDAYAGTGATAIPLAAGGVRVVAIEVDRAAVAQLAARLPAGSRAVAGRVEDMLARALPADVVLLNPPRAGVLEAVTAILQAAAVPPRAVIYVSCDPATLARDLARLPRYRIASLRSFDMFPQTAHVETVCELVPDAA